MKTTILTALLSLTLISNIAFGEEATTGKFQGTTKTNIYYKALGWGEVKNKDAPFCDNIFGVVAWGIITLGIAPLSTCPNSIKDKSDYIDLKLSASYSELETGRGTIRLSSEAVKNCQGLSTLIYTETDGFGGFDMYSSKEDWTNGVKIGSGLSTSEALELTFTKENLIIKSPGKKSSCVFDFGENFFVKLSSK